MTKKKPKVRTTRARKPAKKKAARRRKNLSTRKAPRKTAAKTPGVAKVEASVKRYAKAARLAHERAEDVSAVAQFIADAAVEKFRVSVLADWAERAFLRDVLDLRRLFDTNPDLPKDVQSFRLLPNALLEWLGSRFDMHPFGEVGKVLEIPADKLGNYSYDFDVPGDSGELVSIRIISPGWKRNKTPMIPPRVELVASTNAQEIQSPPAIEHGSSSPERQKS